MSPAPPPRRRVPLVAILVTVVVVLLIGAIAVSALTRDSGGSSSDSSAAGATVEEVRPVTVQGDPLAHFPGNGAGDPAVGVTAPVIDGQSFNGQAESLGGQTGKPTLAVFVAHWCPHCQREVPLVAQWRADGTIPADIDLVGVSTNVAEGQDNYPPSAWLQQVGWPGRIIADDANSTAAAAYGLASFPFFVALDADGKVLARGAGELDQAAIQQLVSMLQGG